VTKLRRACAIALCLGLIFSAGVAMAAITVSLGMSWDVALLLGLPSAATISFIAATRPRGPRGDTMMFAGVAVRMFFTDHPADAILGWRAPRQLRGDSLGEGMISHDDADPRRVIMVWSERRNMVEGFDQPLRMTPGDRLDVQFSRGVAEDATKVTHMRLTREVRSRNE
jgi:hypothetical protein